MRVKLDTNEKWILSAFDDNHTHPFVIPSKVKFIILIGISLKREKHDCHFGNENASINQIVSLVTSQLGGSKNVTFIFKDVRNFAGSAMGNLFGSDVSTTLDYFKHLQVEDHSFFYAIKSVDFRHAQNIFWVDGRLRFANQYFRDVITFNTAYMTNKYNISFVPFIGTNHH